MFQIYPAERSATKSQNLFCWCLLFFLSTSFYSVVGIWDNPHSACIVSSCHDPPMPGRGGWCSRPSSGSAQIIHGKHQKKSETKSIKSRVFKGDYTYYTRAAGNHVDIHDDTWMVILGVHTISAAHQFICSLLGWASELVPSQLSTQIVGQIATARGYITNCRSMSYHYIQLY